MAGLPDSVYKNKLVVIRGPYMLNAPIGLLHGVGPKAADELTQYGIHTIGDMLRRQAHDMHPKLLKHWQTARTEYKDLI